MGDMSEEQEHMVETFKKFCHEENLLTNPQFDDYALLRFLRARKFDFEKTKLMFLNFMEWRKEHDVDNILSVSSLH